MVFKYIAIPRLPPNRFTPVDTLLLKYYCYAKCSDNNTINIVITRHLSLTISLYKIGGQVDSPMLFRWDTANERRKAYLSCTYAHAHIFILCKDSCCWIYKIYKNEFNLFLDTDYELFHDTYMDLQLI